jgi:uncharacterized protein YeaO (DUF488 family)
MTQAKPTSATQHIRLKRVYDPPENSDGFRVLVDRLWPRGLHKDRAALDLWCKDIAPSDSLRKWFGHDPRRFAEFGRRYWQELERNPARLLTSKRSSKNIRSSRSCTVPAIPNITKLSSYESSF